MNLGDRIKQRRNELEWSQEKLAKRAGISKGFLSDVETGKRGIRADTLLDLSRTLGVSLEFLMTGGSDEPNDTRSRPEVEIPQNLALLARDEDLSLRQTLALLDMRRQILAHRSTSDREPLDQIDWRRFYESVKDFL